MAENSDVFETWGDLREALGLNRQSRSTSNSNSNPDPETSPPCGEKLSKIRERHKDLVLRAIRFHFKETPLTVLKFFREKAPYDRTRNLCLEYEAVYADDTIPYLSVCPASLYDSRAGAFGSVFDLTNAIACIEGPSESPYAGGIFFLHVYFPVLYPQRPIKVRFLTQIHHPNISADEDLRLPIITTEWHTKNSLQYILLTIFSLLEEPELNDYYIPEIAKEYIDDYNGFFEKAKLSTIEHASKKRLDVEKLVVDWIQDYVTFDYAVASCNKALLLWRRNIWEALPKDGIRDDVSLQCVLPDSAITTISQNLRRLCTSEIRLDELDLREWGRLELYLKDHSQSSLGNTLVAVWLKLQDKKRGMVKYDDLLPGAASDGTIESCRRMLRVWRDLVWEGYPENTFKDRESVMPDSVIFDISKNLEKIGSGQIKLEHLDLLEWDHSTQLLAEDNKFCLRELLQDLWESEVEAREKTTNTAVPEGGHGSKAEGPKSPQRLQLGPETENSASNQEPLVSGVGVRSGNTRSSRSKPEPRVTESEVSAEVKNSKFKQGYKWTTKAPGAKAESSTSVRGAEIAEDGLDSETGSSKSNKGPHITEDGLDPVLQNLKSEVERLNLSFSIDDLIPIAEKIDFPFSDNDISFIAEKLNLPIPKGKLNSIVEEANRRVKERIEVEGSQITRSDLDPNVQDLKSEVATLNLPITEEDLNSIVEDAIKRLNEGSKGKGSQITKGDLDPDMQDMKSEIEKLNLNLPISVDDLSSITEKLNLPIPEDDLISIAEEANKRLKEIWKGKGAVTKNSYIDSNNTIRTFCLRDKIECFCKDKADYAKIRSSIAEPFCFLSLCMFFEPRYSVSNFSPAARLEKPVVQPGLLKKE